MWEDPRVGLGQARQRAARDVARADGACSIGWKVGFGTESAQAMLGTSGPLVGFLTDRTRWSSGGTVDIGGWTSARLEPELAVWVGRDVPAGGTVEDARAAIDAMSVAFEVVDIDVAPGPEGVEALIAGNLFHRGFILGPPRPVAVPTRCVLEADGTCIAQTDEPTVLPGDPGVLVRHVAELLAACGERLRAGETVITGSVVPMVEVVAGTRYVHRLDPFGEVAVGFV